jgi:uncharacterized membrane protein
MAPKTDWPRRFIQAAGRVVGQNQRISNMSINTDTKSNLENKRAQFTGQSGKKSPLKFILMVAVVVLLAVAGYFAMRGSGDSSSTAAVAKTGDAIRISLADLEGGKARFLNHQLASSTQVRFFALKSTDGKYRAAMDACDTCFHAKKGYRQEGSAMICNNCGMNFPNNLINEVKGGCNPVGVSCSVEGNELVIKTSELESRGSYFQ